MTNFPVRRGVAVLALVSVLVGCTHGAPEAKAAQASVAAETIVITTQPFTEFADGVGSVVPRPGESAALGAPIAARIARVLVVVGQHVKSGDALVELDRTTIDAVARSAEAALVAAEAAAARATRLVDVGVMPRRDAEQATAEAARTRAEVTTARRTAQLSTLRAPLGGVVTRVAATLGALADPNNPLVEIANPEAVDVMLTVTASDAARIHPGMPVSLRTDTDSLGRGSVAAVGGAIDSLSRGIGVRVHVTGSTRGLRLGETLSGRVMVGITVNAITVPIAALVPAGEGFRVFVVDSFGVAHVREVTVAGKDELRAHITAGLAAGERVVTKGAYGMDEGARIAAKGTRP